MSLSYTTLPSGSVNLASKGRLQNSDDPAERDERASAPKLYTLHSKPYTFLTAELLELKTELSRVFPINPTPSSYTEFHGVVTRSSTELALPNPRLVWRQSVRHPSLQSVRRTDGLDRDRLDR